MHQRYVFIIVASLILLGLFLSVGGNEQASLPVKSLATGSALPTNGIVGNTVSVAAEEAKKRPVDFVDSAETQQPASPPAAINTPLPPATPAP